MRGFFSFVLFWGFLFGGLSGRRWALFCWWEGAGVFLEGGLIVYFVGWFIGWLGGWVGGWVAGWLGGWLVGWFGLVVVKAFWFVLRGGLGGGLVVCLGVLFAHQAK